MISPAFIPKDGSSKEDDLIKGITTKPQQNITTPQATPANTTQMPGTTPAGK
jgi:hypothetical protein